MIELKTCPFCGGEAKIHISAFKSEYMQGNGALPKNVKIIREWRCPGSKEWNTEFRRAAYTAQCTDTACIGRSQKKYRTEAEAAEAWNRRADDDKRR
ncbi:MAG: Lar family restriction alleviation protein [Oscillospiraceae bacterium]|nr:Lar family restriction alleviation protein [Oscillospiraceae bacterium]